jgi:hypothetical protein
MEQERIFMPEPDVDVDAILAGLETQSQKLSEELSAIKDDERQAEILATLAAIEEQEKRLREQQAQPQR